MSLYLDHNATSPPTASHLQRLVERLPGVAGNPSSPHAVGRQASVAVTESRRALAHYFQVKPAEVIFVSGATEANNLAIAGVFAYQRGLPESPPVPHLLATRIEHPAILEPLSRLKEAHPVEMTFVSPNQTGGVDLKEMVRALRPETTLVTLMAANNEVGAIQPVKRLGDYFNFKRWGLLPAEGASSFDDLEAVLNPALTQAHFRALHFHVDGVQALGKLEAGRWLSSGIDSIALSAHKLGGLQGIGALILKKGRQYVPLLVGGPQERNRRAGTENVPGIVSFGLVMDDLQRPDWWEKISALRALKDDLYEFFETCPEVRVNSPRGEGGLPNTLHVSLQPPLCAEDVILELDLQGICVSSGSACSSGVNLPSHVLKAMGRSERDAKNGLRLSLGLENTKEDVERLKQALHACFTQNR